LEVFNTELVGELKKKFGDWDKRKPKKRLPGCFSVYSSLKTFARLRTRRFAPTMLIPTSFSLTFPTYLTCPLFAACPLLTAFKIMMAFLFDRLRKLELFASL
jgi:hypothetical protein